MTLVAVEQHQEPYGQQYGVQSRRGHHRGGAGVQLNAPLQDLSTSVESDHDDSMASILTDIGDFFSDKSAETSKDIGYEDVQDGDKSAEDGKVYSGRLGEPGTGMERLPVYSSAVIVPNRNDTSSQANGANPVTTLNGGVKSNSFDSSSNEESNRNKDKELAKQTNSDDNNSVAKAMITPRMKIQFHKSNEPDKVVVTPRPVTTQEPSGVGAIANVFSNTLEKLTKMLGFTPECLNGGTRTARGDCICPKYYQGDRCEEIICVNNGTRVKVAKTMPDEYICKCPHPEYISGAHCELVRCMNGGRAMDNGHCRCLDYWYTGQFCQNYTASWGAVLGVPLVCIVIIIICCVVCRLDLCPRKQTRGGRRRRRAPMSGTLSGTGAIAGGHLLGARRQNLSAYRDANMRRGMESALRVQENLLNEENPNRMALQPADSNGILPSYVIRLNTLPVFNPAMIGNEVDGELKPIDPPPPYDLVIASSGANVNNTGNNTTNLANNNANLSQRPPEYTPHDVNATYNPTISAEAQATVAATDRSRATHSNSNQSSNNNHRRSGLAAQPQQQTTHDIPRPQR